MLVPFSTPLFLSALFFTATTAAPTRTQCRCTIVSNISPATDPSEAHWTPQDPSPSPPARPDFCSSLGDELENFPQAAEAFITSHSIDVHPVNFSSRMGRVDRSQRGRSSQEKGNERIVCRSEIAASPTYQDALPTTTLWGLQIIVFVAVFACVAEGVQLCARWYREARYQSDAYRAMLRYTGIEKGVLLAVPEVDNGMFSPGLEKKLRSYELMPALVMKARGEKREAVAYASGDEDDDDEMNRPVM